ncbi:DsbA family oxidoreductase [uncultured Salinisphaera sp.]|uniref:DsbA family oxidoreductase n=1 Tax=uncultured Salinisphaera sp. TaxID=359372 RepID=UPI0032B18E81|tara:strand:- start:1006 stop:1665 length:660 start_codon:yes stop_codon:yes gene_type:complete
MTVLRIDLVSDIVCPWCAIGLAHLEQAVAGLDDVETELHWHPFLLNPDIEAGGRDMTQHLSQKYGKTAEEVAASQQQIVAAAQACGLNFDGALKRRSYNTFDAHRVLHHAREAGVDDAFNRALFEAYFGHAKDPTDPALLGRIGADLGLDRQDIEAILASDRHAQAVRDEVARFQQMGISAVPSFIVADTYLISGAQPPAALADSLSRIADEQGDAAAS